MVFCTFPRQEEDKEEEDSMQESEGSILRGSTHCDDIFEEEEKQKLERNSRRLQGQRPEKVR